MKVCFVCGKEYFLFEKIDQYISKERCRSCEKKHKKQLKEDWLVLLKGLQKGLQKNG